MRRKPIQTDDYLLMPGIMKRGRGKLRLRQYTYVPQKTGFPADFTEDIDEAHDFYGLEPGAEAVERFYDAVGMWDSSSKSKDRKLDRKAKRLKRAGKALSNKKELMQKGQTKAATKLFQIAHELEDMAQA